MRETEEDQVEGRGEEGGNGRKERRREGREGRKEELHDILL